MITRAVGMTILGLLSVTARAQIFVSANDGKQLKSGEAPSTRTADTVGLYDLGPAGLRQLGAVAVPASMIGPPESVALTPDRRFALVTASQRLDASMPPALVPDGTVSVIDLSDPAAPRVVQTLAAGASASGVAINRQGTLALVANAADDSVSVFAIARGRLEPAGTVRLDPKSRPVSLKFTPDGRMALVVAQNAGTLALLSISGQTVTRAGTDIPIGPSPYSIAIDRAGRYAYITNLRGQPSASDAAAPGTITIVDVRKRVVSGRVVAGIIPEHVALSPSGRYLQLTLINGSNAAPDAANYQDHGVLRVFATGKGTLTPVAEANTGRWCQGAAWSQDERHILLQCADAKRIDVFSFDNRTLVAQPAAGIVVDARPGTLVSSPD